MKDVVTSEIQKNQIWPQEYLNRRVELITKHFGNVNLEAYHQICKTTNKLPTEKYNKIMIINGEQK